MKKLITLLFILSLALILQAQVTKTIDISTAGTLSTVLTTNELNTVTNLTITGTIDARDFKIMRDMMPNLAVIDLGGTTIAAYTGNDGTANQPNFYSNIYNANEIPIIAFSRGNDIWGKQTLTTIILPASTTKINEFAFNYCKFLSSVTISSSLISIEVAAFQECIKLASIDLPSSVTAIKQSAFANCKSLAFIDIPPLVTSISVDVFGNCSALSSISIPASVTSIGASAFIGCVRLKSVTIPDLVTTIGNSAFAGCEGLSSVTIPGSVISIENGAFHSCGGLIDFIVDASNLNYSSQNGVLFDKYGTQLIQFPAQKQGTYTIPSSVTSIKNQAFYYCTGLSSVTIPSSVKSIGEFTFAGCSQLTSIYAYSILPVNINASDYVFYNVNKTICKLYVPAGSKVAYQAANQWKDFKNIVEMTTAVQTADDVKVNLYPNPTTESFHVDGFEGKASLKLIALNGKVVLAKQVTGNETISVSNLPKGVYIVKIVTNGGIVERKLVKN